MTPLWTLLFLVLGIFFSAFFSGSETGFYRATRVRLVLDGFSGDLVSRGLLWLINNPALFVATTLVGNNLANYLVAKGIVDAVNSLDLDRPELAQLLAPVILSPVIFIYGELLPKSLYFRAPNQLLRRGGPLFLSCGVLFAPVSAALWGLGWILQRVVGETPLQVQFTLARKELRQGFEEGQQAGILQSAQYRLAQNLFHTAGMPIIKFAKPITRVAAVPRSADRLETLRMARRQRLTEILLRHADNQELAGYVRTIELELASSLNDTPIHPLLRLSNQTNHVDAVAQIQAARENLACVTDDHDRVLGLVYLQQLTQPLFRGD